MANAGLLSEVLPYFAEPPLVTFVPTASGHRRERGFDHAELLAKELAKLKRWPFARLLVRTSQTRQLGSNRELRKRQLKDAFRVSHSRLIKDTHILLIDDVLTTGATVEACSKILKKAGASLVDGAVFARTPNKSSK
jgi:ComF family protein